MTFDDVKSVTIPDGEVDEISEGGTVLWQGKHGLTISYPTIYPPGGTKIRCESIQVGYTLNGSQNFKLLASNSNPYSVVAFSVENTERTNLKIRFNVKSYSAGTDLYVYFNGAQKLRTTNYGGTYDYNFSVGDTVNKITLSVSHSSYQDRVYITTS